MTGGVDQVEDVLLAIHADVAQPHGLRLDRDPPLPFQIHRVENLLAHVAFADSSGALEQAIGQGRLAVVDVGDDREVADARSSGHESGGPPL